MTEASTMENTSDEGTPSEAEESSSKSSRLVNPMVRFLESDSEDTLSGFANSPMQEAALEAEDSSLEENESLDSLV